MDGAFDILDKCKQRFGGKNPKGINRLEDQGTHGRIDGKNWIHLAKDTDKWQALCFLIYGRGQGNKPSESPEHAGNVLTTQRTIY